MESTGLFIKNLNSQTPWIRSLGLVPRTPHSDPFLLTFDLQQSYRSTCNGGMCGEDLPQGAGSIRGKRGRSQVKERCRSPALTFLLLSWFSSQPGLKPGLTPPLGADYRRNCQNGASVSSCRPWGSWGLPCRRKDPNRGNRSKGAVGTWRDHTDPPTGSGWSRWADLWAGRPPGPAGTWMELRYCVVLQGLRSCICQLRVYDIDQGT